MGTVALYHYHKSLGKNIWQEQARNKPVKLWG